MPVCLTDINNVSGIPDFFREAKQHPQLHPCAGIDFRESETGGRCLYVGIAENEIGFAEMNRFLSQYRLAGKKLPPWPPKLDCVHFILPFERTQERGFPEKLSENHWIGIRSEQIGKLRLSPWQKHPQKLLAMQPCTFRHTEDFESHRLLRCIANNCLLSKLPAGETGHEKDRYMRPEALLQNYTDAPFLVENTLRLMQRCTFCPTFGGNQNKKTFTGNADEDFRLMTDLAMDGLRYRYPQYNYATKQRLESEMKLIYELGFTAYFLISWDICRFAREQGFFYVGRGSGANSMVAYCLRITDVDPIDLDLYFERFINPYRTSPPDFDLDFSWQDRDKITEYIFKKHGREHTALLATYSTFQSNAVVRELGKVFGLPKEEIDHLMEKPTYFSPSMLEEQAGHKIRDGKAVYTSPGIGEKAILSKSVRPQQRDTLAGEIMRHALRLHELPNYRSIHAGGILISDKSIYHYSALDMPPKGFPTVQWSMLEAEDLGLAKFDILSQRGLGHIKDAVRLVKENTGEDIDIHRIQDFKTDEKIKRVISSGHTMGCFYVESPAMRQLLRKLKCNDYLTLVAASSVIRPGVARSGMMRSFIERHINPEKRKEAHPVLQKIMPDTYGIMVYQEDVIKVAHHFAGLGLAESDVLRRGMSGKFRSREEFQKVKDRFFTLCKEKGHPEKLSAEVWHQIESFAGYSFAKGHSASYAVESYQSLYLKAYHPLEFYVGVINNFGGFYRTEFYLHGARMCGADIEPPCINHSDYLTNINGRKVHLGFVHVSSLEQKLAEHIVAERNTNGPYLSLFDFKERVEPGLEQLKILIRIGALRFTGKSRKELMWEAHWLVNRRKPVAATEKLFRESPRDFALPELSHNALEDAYEQIELLGFPLISPFELLAPETLPQKPILSKHLEGMQEKTVQITGYLVTIKPTRTIKGQEMNFGTWLDVSGHFFDTLHFPDALKRFPFKGRGIYRLIGIVTDDFGVYSIAVSHMEKIPYIPDPRYE
ncbi:MAG: DNA polymerase III subunit alpha [Bacteroidetes bacterium]|nr:DNA polymerase III subunit alpha [Bacteroidota bacterium]